MRPTFEYCAAHYLNQWARKEEKLVDGLRLPTPPTLRAALSYFKVARGFSGIADVEVCKKVVDLLVRHDRYVTPKTASKRVTDLADALGISLGYDNLLSAASKLLWLRSQSPFIILDSRALSALRILKFGSYGGDYAGYVQAWRTAYAEHRLEIARATRQLPQFVEFTAVAHLGKTYVSELASQEWFAERIFDQYLWQIGAPNGVDLRNA